MKKTLLYGVSVAIATLIAAASAQAQTANAGAVAGASAGASANSASQSGAFSASRGGNASVNNSTTYRAAKNVGAIGMAGLAASSGCMGSTSAGVGFINGSIGFGTTWQDDRCNAREDARLLAAFGYRQQALQILVNHSPMVREVFAPQAAQQPVYARPGKPVPVAVSSRYDASSCTVWRDGVKGGVCRY